MKRYPVFLLLAVTLNFFSGIASGGSSYPWAEQFRLPNAAILWSNGVVFGDCFDTKDYGNHWHYCGDKENLSSSFVVRSVAAVLLGLAGDAWGLRTAFLASGAGMLVGLPLVVLLPKTRRT